MQGVHLLDHELRTVKMVAERPPKRWFLVTKLLGATTQKV